MSYDKNDKNYYHKHKIKLMENQQRYRSKPEVRERYLQKARENSKKWYSISGNRERRYQYNKEAWLRHVKKLEEIAGRPRPNKCEICNAKTRIVFDHNHKTGKFRGWICETCNTFLGKVKDDKGHLQALIDYLDLNLE